MPCNCGKAAATRQQQSVRQAPKPPPRPTGPAAVSMPGGKPMKGVTQAFTLTLDGGRTQSFGSALEAQAALVRAGGRGRVS